MRLPVNLTRFSSQISASRRLPFPASPKLRIAELRGSASFDSVAAFARERWIALETYRPRVLVGSPNELHAAAEMVESGKLELSSVDHALFALTECGHEPLSDVVRVVLWQAFGVPVYELLVSPDGGLLASECEAHEGWHAELNANPSIINGELVVEARGRKRLRTGLSASLATEPCPCGRVSPRIMAAQLLASGSRPRQLAAIA